MYEAWKVLQCTGYREEKINLLDVTLRWPIPHFKWYPLICLPLWEWWEFPTINQPPKPKKYMGMNFSYYQLALLTTYKVFSLSSTNLPGLDFQTDVRSDFSWVFSYLLGVQLLHQYFVCTQVCMSQMDCVVSLEIIFKVIFKLNSILIGCRKMSRSIHIWQFVLPSLLHFLQSSHSYLRGSKSTQLHQMLQEFSPGLTIWSASAPSSFAILISKLNCITIRRVMT